MDTSPTTCTACNHRGPWTAIQYLPQGTRAPWTYRQQLALHVTTVDRRPWTAVQDLPQSTMYLGHNAIDLHRMYLPWTVDRGPSSEDLLADQVELTRNI